MCEVHTLYPLPPWVLTQQAFLFVCFVFFKGFKGISEQMVCGLDFTKSLSKMSPQDWWAMKIYLDTQNWLNKYLLNELSPALSLETEFFFFFFAFLMSELLV